MKPISIGLLFVACSFGSAALAYFLFESNQPTQQTVAVAPEVDPGQQDKIRTLETRMEAIERKLDESLELQRDTVVRHETEEPAKLPATGDEAVQPKADADPAKLKELAERLDEIESGEKAMRALRDQAIIQLNSGDGRDQAEAARLLGQLAMGGDEAAKKALREAMKSEDADVREWAVEGLNDTGLVEFLPELELLMKDPEPDVREEVTQTLESMPADKAGPLLVSMLQDTEPDVLIGAIEVLGDLEYKASITDLLPLTRHADEEVSIAASIAMKQCGDSSAAESWVPTLGARLKSDDANERRRAIRNLRHMRLESSRVYLEEALEDSDRRVRQEAQRALDRLNGN